MWFSQASLRGEGRQFHQRKGMGATDTSGCRSPGEARVDGRYPAVSQTFGCEMDYHFAGEIALDIAENVPDFKMLRTKILGDAGVKLASEDS